MDIAEISEQEMLTQRQLITKAAALGDSPIQKFYEGGSVFITGGSGFIGKLLIEKLCRVCSLKNVYVLIRRKKNKSVPQRLEGLLEDPVFEILHKEQPNFFTKIIPLEGDITENRLGLRENDWNTITKEVHTIFHVAANVRFDVELKNSILCNVKGTREALLLGRACEGLRAFVYVSTAYTYATNHRVGEIVYEDLHTPPATSELLVKMAETMSRDTLNELTPALTKGWPNTYTYSKAIAEEAVHSLGEGLPVCIVRPAIVISAYMEPSPGWIDVSNVYGPTGLVLGAGMGLISIVCANLETRMSFVPADFVTNAVIAAGWETGSKPDIKLKQPEVYAVSNIRNPITWGEMSSIWRQYKYVFATPSSLWYCGVYETKSLFLFWFFTWLFHLVPAYFLDCICVLIKKERKFVKLYKQVYKMSLLLSYFTRYDWQFSDENLLKLYQKMSAEDQIIFNFNTATVNWPENLKIWWLGIRKYIIKDGLKSTKKGNIKQRIFLVANYLLLALYLYLIINFFCYAFYGFCTFLKLFPNLA